MGWFGKDKSKKTLKNQDKQTGKGSAVQPLPTSEGAGGIQGNKSQRPDSTEIRAQALANARKAREAIGEEALQKIAAAIQKKQQSATERAKAQIAATDADRVAEEILLMLETKH
jgi:hypothetical protein